MEGTDFRVTFLLYLNLQCYKCTITIMSVWSSVVHIVMLNVVPCTKRVILGTQKLLSSLKEQEIRPAMFTVLRSILVPTWDISHSGVALCGSRGPWCTNFGFGAQIYIQGYFGGHFFPYIIIVVEYSN